MTDWPGSNGPGQSVSGEPTESTITDVSVRLTMAQRVMVRTELTTPLLKVLIPGLKQF